MTRTTLPWLLCLPVAACIAYGQGAPPRFEIFAEGGGSFLSDGNTGSISSLDGTFVYPIGFSSSERLFTGIRLGLTRHDALEASYAYSPNPYPLAYAPPDRLDVVSFNYVRYFAGGARVQPFATAGIGGNRFSGFASQGFPRGTGFYFGGNFGAGADIVLQRHLALRLELRDYVGVPPSFLSGTSHNLVPSAGVVFRFK